MTVSTQGAFMIGAFSDQTLCRKQLICFLISINDHSDSPKWCLCVQTKYNFNDSCTHDISPVNAASAQCLCFSALIWILLRFTSSPDLPLMETLRSEVNYMYSTRISPVLPCAILFSSLMFRSIFNSALHSQISKTTIYGFYRETNYLSLFGSAWFKLFHRLEIHINQTKSTLVC